MSSKDLSNSSKFERIDIFKTIKTKTKRNMSGKKVSMEIFLKIKNK